MNNFAPRIFKYRSYTPLPFVLLMLIFQKATITSIFIGFAIVLCGEFFRLWGVCYAGSETRTTDGVGGTYLVVSGSFAYVRNPLYLGNMLMYLGVGIMSMALFPYLHIAAFLFFFWQYTVIIKEEEGFLRTKFGKSYEDYLKVVPKFIPSLSKYSNFGIEQPPLNIKAGLRSEIRTMQAILAISFLVIIRFVLN
ncbi:MAG: isoprenylcysteine carboxylmethyltransferase family protein [Ignavibacteriales bacterium]|nr:MAG: isoprenylcysteine carboxylmethyltransferase family protein [Ignavibacteriales bacterium]